MKYSVEKNILSDAELKSISVFAKSAPYMPCPTWLGYYKRAIYELEDLGPFGLPDSFQKIALLVLPLVGTEQSYNTITLEQYNEGDTSSPHYDPRDVKGYVISIPFGNYEGGTVIIDKEEIELSPGDVLIRQATTGFGMGPRHNVAVVENGTKYVLEFLTIIKEDSS